MNPRALETQRLQGHVNTADKRREMGSDWFANADQAKDMRLMMIDDEVVLEDGKTVRECKLDSTDGSIVALLHPDNTVESGWEGIDIHDWRHPESE